MSNGALRRWVAGVGAAMVIGAVPAVAQFEAGIAVGAKAPVISVGDLEGTVVDLGRFIGKQPVLIEFWASWCELCKALLPQLEVVKKTYGTQVALVGINITVNDSRERVRRYLARHQPPFLTLYDEKGVGSRAYDVPATSFIVIVDSEGKVAYTGSGEDQDLLAAVRKVVGK